MNNYQVLARKWRPQVFSDVVGQEHVLATLTNSLSLKRIHHSILFSGVRGVGKTTIARLLAKCLNCKTGITAIPCRICDSCRAIETGHFIDLIEIDAASHTKVEEIRDLLESMQYSPVQCRFKICLIDEVHMLSRYSFNALLKTLEEPPAHVSFLLATTDPQKLPTTVLSRCLQFHLKVLSIEQICNQLKRILNAENIHYDMQALQLLARASEGSLRDALNLTDHAIANCNGNSITVEIVNTILHTVDDNLVLSLIEAIIEKNGERIIMLVNNAASYSIEWERLLITMQILLHRILVIQVLSLKIHVNMTDDEKRIYKLAHAVSHTDMQLYYQILLTGRKELQFSPDFRMGTEITLLRMLSLVDFKQSRSKIGTECRSDIFPIHTKTTLSTETLQKNERNMLQEQMSLSNMTNQVLSARNQLYHIKEITNVKKNKQILTDKKKC